MNKDDESNLPRYLTVGENRRKGDLQRRHSGPKDQWFEKCEGPYLNDIISSCEADEWLYMRPSLEWVKINSDRITKIK